MESKKQEISTKHKQFYLQLIVKQKAAALDRCQRQLSEVVDRDEQELLRLTNQPSCRPNKLQAKDVNPMSDEDYLLAELNGHFE